MLNPLDLQLQTLRLYGTLLSHRDAWGGKLVFASGPGASATGLPAAVSIAGGTTLILDSDAAIVKSVFRQGGIDFVVNTLDEALRVLKNEIRQHKPLSVGLISHIEPVIHEIAERGVSPDFQFKQELDSKMIPETSESALFPWLSAQNWSEVTLSTASPAELRALDLRFLDILPVEDVFRRRWLQRITHYQRPNATPTRVIWLTPEERAVL